LFKFSGWFLAETCEQAGLTARLPPDGLLSHVSV
jgi:hypothetical protein